MSSEIENKTGNQILYTAEIKADDAAYASEIGLNLDVRAFIETVQNRYQPDRLKKQILDFRPDIIAISSQNAVPATADLKAMNLSCDILALGPKTQKALLNAGFKSIVSPVSHAEGLAEFIIANYQSQKVLHLCGNLKNPILQEKLEASGFQYLDLEVYFTQLIQPSIDLNKYKGAAFLSYSAIDSFFSEYQLTQMTPLFSIGPKTSDYLKQFTNQDILTAAKPEVRYLLDTIKNYFNHD